MEPFFLRCETCHARLRVRDERFLGQVQSCPKCGSMVQILAPAGWSAARRCSPDLVERDQPSPTTGSPTAAVRFAGAVRRHAMLWSTGSAARVDRGRIGGCMALRGGEEVAVRSDSPPVVDRRRRKTKRRRQAGRRCRRARRKRLRQATQQVDAVDNRRSAGAPATRTRRQVEPPVVTPPQATPVAEIATRETADAHVGPVASRFDGGYSWQQRHAAERNCSRLSAGIGCGDERSCR